MNEGRIPSEEEQYAQTFAKRFLDGDKSTFWAKDKPNRTTHFLYRRLVTRLGSEAANRLCSEAIQEQANLRGKFKVTGITADPTGSTTDYRIELTRADGKKFYAGGSLPGNPLAAKEKLGAELQIVINRAIGLRLARKVNFNPLLTSVSQLHSALRQAEKGKKPKIPNISFNIPKLPQAVDNLLGIQGKQMAGIK